MKRRIIYLDIVKVVGIFLVLFAHTDILGTKLYTIVGRENYTYPVYIFLDCLRTINNPLFFMASGALLLDGSIEPYEDESKEWMKKNGRRIWRIIVIIIFFSILQYFYKVHIGQMENMKITTFASMIYTSPIHFTYWFLYAYLGFLIMLPITRIIAKNISFRQFLYLVTVGVVFIDILPCFQFMFNMGGSLVSNYLYINVWNLSIFPIVGYCLHKNMEKILNRKSSIFIISLFAILGIIVAAILTDKDMIKNGAYSESFISQFNLLSAIAVFCWCYKLGKYIKENTRIYKLVTFVSTSIFGIYLMENFIEDNFSRKVYNFLPEKYPRLVICGLVILLTIAIGSVSTNILKKIPIVRKYL